MDPCFFFDSANLDPIYYRRPDSWIHKITYCIYFWISDLKTFLILASAETSMKKQDERPEYIKEIQQRKQKTHVHRAWSHVSHNVQTLDPCVTFALFVTIYMIEIYVILYLSRCTASSLDPLAHSYTEYKLKYVSKMNSFQGTRNTTVVVVGLQDTMSSVVERWLSIGQPSIPMERYTVIRISDPTHIICPHTLPYETSHRIKTTDDPIRLIYVTREPVDLLSCLIQKEHTEQGVHAKEFDSLVKNILKTHQSMSFSHHIKHMLTMQIHNINQCDKKYDADKTFTCYTDHICSRTDKEKATASRDYGLLLGMHDHILKAWKSYLSRSVSESDVNTVVLSWEHLMNTVPEKIQSMVMKRFNASNVASHALSQSISESFQKTTSSMKDARDYVPLEVRVRLYPIFNYHMKRLDAVMETSAPMYIYNNIE